jgi:hypothetical protein
MRKLNENEALLTVSAHFTQRKSDEEKKSFYNVDATVVYVVFIAVAVADAVRGLAEDGASGLKSSFNCDCKCDSFVWC